MEIANSVFAFGPTSEGIAFSVLWAYMKLGTTYQDILLALAAFVSFRYAWKVFRYRQLRRRFHKCDQLQGQVPPTYPTLIPILGNAIDIACNTALFTRVATYYKGRSTSTRVSALGSALYLFQDRATVVQIMRVRSALAPLTTRNILPAKFLFRMPESCGLNTFRIVNTGALKEPRPESEVTLQNRVNHLRHEEFRQAFGGPELHLTASRFRQSIMVLLSRSMRPFAVHRDNYTPWLVRMIPRWLNARPYKARDKVLEQIQEWYTYARQASKEHSPENDGSDEMFWGSKLVGRLQGSLVDTGKQSDQAMSAHDLGWIWGAATNPGSAAALALFHIYDDHELLARLRTELHLTDADQVSATRINEFPDFKQLHLLSSVYGETMRLYSNVFLVLESPPNKDIPLGKWKLPRRSTGLISSYLAHTDDQFWNTKDDSHPVDTFWAERFLIYPTDPLSGPIKPEIRARRRNEQVEHKRDGVQTTGSPWFSTSHLKGSYMPFGAGAGTCPGRLLAKDLIMFTCALFISEYDVEILAKPLDYNLELGPWRYGLGIEQPARPIPARIRRRS
ncbi:cytochrome P450 [Xylariaceae sp. FL1272]|nr:cytochrome P450 [Xylariaceae sp. FL1272]